MTDPTSTRTRRRLAALSVALVAATSAACIPPSTGGGGGSTTSTTVAPCGTTATSRTTTSASGGSVTVTPIANLCRTGQTVTVAGTGWSTTASGGVGIYVAYGPSAASFWTDASLFASAKWIHPGATPSAGQDVLHPDGTFSTTISVPAQFTNSAGPVDCTVTTCTIYTMTAHGIPNRTQDTATTLSFHS